MIAAATLRLHPIAGPVMMVTERRVEDLDEHLATLEAAEAPHVVGWIDATATGRALGRGIVEEAETGRGLVPPRKPARRVPLDVPGFALSAPVVRGFNAAYWRRVPASGRTLVRPFGDFFFPLDRVHDWNRLYGRRGFHQFQCVLPPGAEAALRAVLETVAASGLASPLAVLKRMGLGRAGHLSFPMEGWTLAVDFPARPAAMPLLRRLTAMAADAGGRIYFAKDSLAEASAVAPMYPELDDWRGIVAEIDPERRLVTDLVRRLGLRGAA
jgi:decaprenylphospho-beta-D-ribofuranose 2-oxidase